MSNTHNKCDSWHVCQVLAHIVPEFWDIFHSTSAPLFYFFMAFIMWVNIKSIPKGGIDFIFLSFLAFNLVSNCYHASFKYTNISILPKGIVYNWNFNRCTLVSMDNLFMDKPWICGGSGKILRKGFADPRVPKFKIKTNPKPKTKTDLELKDVLKKL